MAEHDGRRLELQRKRREKWGRAMFQPLFITFLAGNTEIVMQVDMLVCMSIAEPPRQHACVLFVRTRFRAWVPRGAQWGTPWNRRESTHACFPHAYVPPTRASACICIARCAVRHYKPFLSDLSRTAEKPSKFIFS